MALAGGQRDFEFIGSLTEVRVVLLQLGLQIPESAIDASNPHSKQFAETRLNVWRGRRGAPWPRATLFVCLRTQRAAAASACRVDLRKASCPAQRCCRGWRREVRCSWSRFSVAVVGLGESVSRVAAAVVLRKRDGGQDDGIAHTEAHPLRTSAIRIYK